MDIKQLTYQLEEKIKIEVEELEIVAKRIKHYMESGAPQRNIDQECFAFFDRLAQLSCCRSLVIDRHPKIAAAFIILINMRQSCVKIFTNID